MPLSPSVLAVKKIGTLAVDVICVE